MTELKDLKQEINKLVEKAEKDTGEKPFHYLGWFWRDLDLGSEYERFSFHDHLWWLDCAGKWDYPSKNIDGKELQNVLEIIKKIIENQIKLQDILKEGGVKNG